MFIWGVLLFLVGLFFITLMGANLELPVAIAVLFDLPTTFAFIIAITSVIVATGSFKTFITAINALLSKKYSISAADKEKAVRLFQLIGKTVVYASVLFAVMGIMLMLRSLSDPYSIGPKVSIALCSLFQGTLINLILVYPAINVLETRYNVEERTVISEKQVIDKLLELCYRQGVSPEEILNAREIHFQKRQ